MLKMFGAICSLLLVAVTVSSQTTKSSFPESPCPNIFTYEPNPVGEKLDPGVEKWFGVVKLSTDITLHALWLNIILDSKADILGNWVGEVTTEDNLNFKVENTKMKLTPGPPLAVRFFIQYNAQKKAPRVQSILFNGREICNAEPVNFFQQAVETPVRADDYNLVAAQTTTTTKPVTVVTAKYDRSQTKATQRTTSNPGYWTQKVGTTQTTTEKNKPSKTENKAANSAIVWNWSQTDTGNTQQSKPNTVKNKEQMQTSSSSSQSTQNWGQNNQQRVTQTESKTQSSTANQQIQTKIKAASYQQAVQQKQQTTESQIQAIFGTAQEKTDRPSTSDRQQAVGDKTIQAIFGTAQQKPDNRQSTDNRQQAEDKTKYQLWSQISVDSIEPVRVDNQNFGNLRTTTENAYNKDQYYNTGNTDNNQDIINRHGPKESSQISDGRHQVSPVSNRNDGRLEVRPITRQEGHTVSAPVSAYLSPDEPKVEFQQDTSRFSDKESHRDVTEHDQPLHGYQVTTQRPSSSAANFPIVHDFDDGDSTSDKDELYPSAGLPTIYIPSLRPEDHICGTVLKKRPQYLSYGASTSEGQWPWQTAIYQQQTVDFKYICGGTLVSRRHVITAAHCVTRKKSRREVNKNTLTVYLGKHNLRTSVEGVQVKFVNRIIVHPDYNATYLSRDLAILEFRDSASYTEWVRPACLWLESEIGLRNIIGKKGSVVGWGFDVIGVAKEELSLLEMPVVDQDTCINSYNIYEQFTSSYTYCARYKDDTSVCNGDSGGGMVFRKSGSWYLRGVASLSVTRHNDYRCDSKNYVIFTDIAKFLPWIEEQID